MSARELRSSREEFDRRGSGRPNGAPRAGPVLIVTGAREEALQWSYEIVPVGGHHRLADGSFDAPDIEAAKRHVQTVYERTVSAEAELDVRLLDGSGREVWRGTYVGPNT